MALFDLAFEKTMKWEGGYVHDPEDYGGETFMGISRRFHPTWRGWYVVNQLDMTVPGNKYILEGYVEEFYREHYWDISGLTKFSSQRVANIIFDTGVNLGVKKAAQFLQEDINLLNNNQARWLNVVVDGRIGPDTIHHLEKCLKAGYEQQLVTLLNADRVSHYKRLMKLNERQEKFAIGWLNRVHSQF